MHGMGFSVGPRGGGGDPGGGDPGGGDGWAIATSIASAMRSRAIAIRSRLDSIYSDYKLGCEPGHPVLWRWAASQINLRPKKNNFVSVRPDSSKINGCKKRNVLFMLFQLLLSWLLLLRVLLWRYVITCSSLHVAFVAGAVVAILLLFMLFSPSLSTTTATSTTTTTPTPTITTPCASDNARARMGSRMAVVFFTQRATR